MVLGAVAGGASIGAGVGLSSVGLMPFNAANTFLGSAFFGYGMILGERYMYQADWPKIQARLEHGEKIENIIQEYTGVFTAVVMKEAKIIFESVTKEMIDIIKAAAGISETSTTLDVSVETPTTEQPTPEPFIDTGEKTSIKQDETGTVETTKTITNAIGRTRHATTNGNLVFTLWSISAAGTLTKVSSILFTSLVNAMAYASQFWLDVNYTTQLTNGDVFWTPK